MMCKCVCVSYVTVYFCMSLCVCVCVHVCVLQHVDPVMARSFAQLAAIAVKKRALESDPLLVSYNYIYY